MQFHIDAIMIVALNHFPIKSNRMVSGIRVMNAISTSYCHQAFMSAETAENSYHAPIGNAIANTNPEVWIVERSVILYHARITRINFEIAFVERF